MNLLNLDSYMTNLLIMEDAEEDKECCGEGFC